MTKYRYPAPFDPPDPEPVEISGAPLPPSYCGPPLPVDIPVDKVKTERRRSLYRDLFGTDLSAVAEAFGAPWASGDQQTLAAQILDGRKLINSLSTQELDLLDDLAIRFSDQGSLNETMRQADGERLRVPDSETDRRKDTEEVQSESENDLRSDVLPDITGAYGWIRGDKEGSE